MLASAGIKTGTAEAAAFLAKPATIAKLTGIGAASEGAMTAGSIQEAGRQAGRDYTDTAPAAVAGGLGTAAISLVTSKIPGFRDAEVGAAVAGMGGAQRQSLAQVGKEIAKGIFKEGVLEELPQSAQEQVFTNLALGKPWDEGVPEAAAQGMVAGAGMGGGMNTYSAARNALGERREQDKLQRPDQDGTAQGEATQAPGVTGTTSPSIGPIQIRGSASALEAVGVGSSSEAEKALRTPVALTALDRVDEVDAEISRIAQLFDGGGRQA